MNKAQDHDIAITELAKDFDRMVNEARISREKQQTFSPLKVSRSGSAYGEGKPLISTSLGVHTDQVAERNEMLKRHGVTCAHYRPQDGKLEITSRKARNEVLRIHNYIDRDAGYGDRS